MNLGKNQIRICCFFPTTCKRQNSLPLPALPVLFISSEGFSSSRSSSQYIDRRSCVLLRLVTKTGGRKKTKRERKWLLSRFIYSLSQPSSIKENTHKHGFVLSYQTTLPPDSDQIQKYTRLREGWQEANPWDLKLRKTTQSGKTPYCQPREARATG